MPTRNRDRPNPYSAANMGPEFLFKLLVLVGIGVLYVAFEAVFARLGATPGKPRMARAATSSQPTLASVERMGIEAFRPISSWRRR